MPMTVVTLTSVPSSLRGDLTKWLQEISTGVYVGNINVRIRKELWKRIVDNIKDGQATMSYAKRSETGYDCIVHNTNRKVIYYDGIPLVFIPNETTPKEPQKLGFSNAAKYEKIKRNNKHKKNINEEYVVVDLETTGINAEKDKIIEVAAIKKEDEKLLVFKELVIIDKVIR